MTTERPGRAFARSVSVGAASLVAATAAAVLLVGWYGGVAPVRSVLPGLVTMKANTAVGFVLFGVAANPLVRQRHRRVADGAAALLLLLGAATTFQYLVGVDLGIDELLVADPTATGADAPGRPALNTSIGFVLLAGGSLLGDHRNRAGVRIAAQVAAGTTLALSALALLGYLLGATAARGIGSATEMALHTSVLFVVAAVGLGAKTADVGLLTVLLDETEPGRTARVLLPTTVGALLLGVAAVEGLAVFDQLDDVRLQLALTTVVGLGVVAVAVLAAMQQLARSERRADVGRAELAAVRAMFPDAHLRIDADGRVGSVHGDPTDFGLTGVRVGATLEMVEEPEVAGALTRALAECRTRGQHVGRTYEVATGEGPATFEARLVPFGEGDVALAVRDVSHLESARRELVRVNRELASLNARLETEVAERTAELEQSNRELERFAYLASHDLQEPLRMVTSFVSRIAERYGDQLDERGRQYVHFAVDGAERMQGLIEGLLAYSRAGRLAPERVRPLDLAVVVRDVLAAASEQVADVDGTVTTELGPAPVTGDPVLLRQVVQNLLGNALKFSRPDTTPSVTITTTTRDGRAVLEVADDGIGIAPEDRQRVFEMFRRFSTDPAHRGTGIGLSLVQQVVAAHEGTVEVDDAPGGSGSRFTVTLPLEGPAR